MIDSMDEMAAAKTALRANGYEVAETPDGGGLIFRDGTRDDAISVLETVTGGRAPGVREADAESIPNDIPADQRGDWLAAYWE